MDIKEKYLICVDCGGSLKNFGSYLICNKCQRKYKYSDGIFDCIDKMEADKKFSQEKWDIFYRKWFKGKNISLEYKKILEDYQTYGVDQIKKYYKVNKKTVFLELGCGNFVIGTLMAKDCKLVIGIDFSLEALKVAKKILESNKIKNYLLIRGDIFKIPLKKGTVDLLYGGGVIEHFKDTEGCVKEFSRIVNNGGVALNAVPLLNIGALTYRQFWGNIPDFPLIKQIAELIHVKLLRGKHMYFGYELSFTRNKLKKLHQKFGFKRIDFLRLETKVLMGFLPKFLRPMAIYLAENWICFWPMMLVVAKK